MKTNGYPVNPETGLKEKDGFKCSSWTVRKHWCVAVRIKDDGVSVRDTKDPSDTTLNFTKEEWVAFVNGVKSGEFDVKVEEKELQRQEV